jgi:hypothetical protein
MLSAQTAASTSSGVVERERSVVVQQERSVVEERRRQPVGEDEEEPEFRDIHALSPPPSYRRGRGESWGSAAGGSRHTSIRSVGSDTAPSEPFPTMSREFSAMVAAAATATANAAAAANGAGSDADRDVDAMGRIGEGDELEETNPLAIVPDSNPIPSPRRVPPTPGADVALAGTGAQGHGGGEGGVSVGQVKKEEVESKIAAWQIAEVAKVNNRFKREEVVINGWEGDQVEKASGWLKKYEVIDHRSADQTPHSIRRRHFADPIDPEFLLRACRGSWRRSVPRRWRRRRTRWPRRGGRRRRSARRRRPSGAPRWRACWSSPTS